MSDEHNTRVVLVKRPNGAPKPEDFRVESVPCDPVRDGEVQVDVHFVDVQPAMRGWLVEQPAYTPSIPLGATMRAQGVGRVVASRHAGFKPGTYVLGPNFGVQSRLRKHSMHAGTERGSGRVRGPGDRCPNSNPDSDPELGRPDPARDPHLAPIPSLLPNN